MANGLDRLKATARVPGLASLGFCELPAQVVTIDEMHTDVRQQWVAGLRERWLMPCASYTSTGFDAMVPEQFDHHTLAFNLGPDQVVERINGPLGGTRVRHQHFNIQHQGETHHYRSAGAVDFAHLYFRQGLLEHVAETAGRSAGGKPLLRDNLVACPDVVTVSDADSYLARASSLNDPPSALEMDARALVICLGLLERHSSCAFAREATRGGLAPWQLKRVCEAMQAQLDQDITLARLAALVGLSSTHFCRAFKQSTGHPPFAWLLLQRIERAKRLLAASQDTLADIALAVGFAAQPQFTTAFRRVTGVTPGAWRRERRS